LLLLFGCQGKTIRGGTTNKGSACGRGRLLCSVGRKKEKREFQIKGTGGCCVLNGNGNIAQ